MTVRLKSLYNALARGCEDLMFGLILPDRNDVSKITHNVVMGVAGTALVIAFETGHPWLFGSGAMAMAIALNELRDTGADHRKTFERHYKGPA